MKNTDRLEEFVKGHRDEFDHLEPSADVWNKIQANQKKGRTVKMPNQLFKVAAVVAIIAVSAVILVNSNFLDTRGMAKITDPELKELLETEMFYAQKVNGKLNEIRKCYATFP